MKRAFTVKLSLNLCYITIHQQQREYSPEDFDETITQAIQNQLPIIIDLQEISSINESLASQIRSIVQRGRENDLVVNVAFDRTAAEKVNHRELSSPTYPGISYVRSYEGLQEKEFSKTLAFTL